MPHGTPSVPSSGPGPAHNQQGLDAHCRLPAGQGASPTCEACEVSLAPGRFPNTVPCPFHSI